MAIFLRMDRLSCHVSPNSVAASFLLFGGLEQEASPLSLLLTARAYAGISWCDKNTEP